MRRFIKYILVLCLLFATFTIAFGNDTNPCLYFNDEKVNYTSETGYPYINETGEVMVPFAKTMKAFDAEVLEFKEINVIIARRGKKRNYELGCCIGGDNKLKYRHNDLIDENENSVYCAVKDDIVYFPAKPVFKAYECEYVYDSENNKVKIDYKKEKIFNVIAPKYSSEDTEVIEFVMDDNCSIYEGHYKGDTSALEPVAISNDKKLTVKVGERYSFNGVYPDGDYLCKVVRIKKETSDNYLNVDTKRYDDSIRITGKTKNDSKVTINDKTYTVHDSKFSCNYFLKEGTHKIRVRSYGKDSNKYLQETIEYTYDPEANNDDDDDDDDKRPIDPYLLDSETDDDGVKTIKYKRYKRNHAEDSNKEKLPTPTIHFDNLPLKSNKKIIKISGFAENATQVIIHAGKDNPGSKFKGTYGEKLKFECVVILWDKDDRESYKTSEGVLTYFQVVAENNDKTTVKQGDILLIEDE